MIRDGLDKYIPETEYSLFAMEYSHQEHVKRVEDHLKSIRPKEDNPFCINTPESGLEITYF